MTIQNLQRLNDIILFYNSRAKLLETVLFYRCHDKCRIVHNIIICLQQL